MEEDFLENPPFQIAGNKFNHAKNQKTKRRKSSFNGKKKKLVREKTLKDKKKVPEVVNVVDEKGNKRIEKKMRNVDPLKNLLVPLLTLYGIGSDYIEEYVNIIETRAKDCEEVEPEMKVEIMYLLKNNLEEHIGVVKKNEFPLLYVQSWIRTSLVNENMPLLKSSYFRNQFFGIMLKSERSYVNMLHCAVSYRQKLMAVRRELDIEKEDIDIIFSSIDSLIHIAEKFLVQLNIVNGYSPLFFHVGSTILRFLPNFYEYCVYVQGLPSALLKLHDLKIIHPEFDEWLKTTKFKTRFPTQTLADLLNLPSKQMDKYEEYLFGMVNSFRNYYRKIIPENETECGITKSEFKEYNNLNEAYLMIRQLRLLVENSVQNNATFMLEHIQNIVSGIPFDLFDNPSRTFMKEGQISLKSKIRKYYLFNDILMIVEPMKLKVESKFIQMFLLEKIIPSRDFQKNPVSGLDFEGEYEVEGNERKKIQLSVLPTDRDFLKLLYSQIEITSSKSIVFGVSLSLLQRRGEVSAEGIPLIVSQIVNYLSKEDRLKTQGILRKSGKQSTLQQCKEIADEGGRVDFGKDVHSAAGLLKLFFRSLPEPLLTFNLYYTFLECSDSLESLSVEEGINLIRTNVSKLPKNNLRLLEYICNFLLKISSFSSENLMTNENLSIVFATNLLKPEIETHETAFHSARINKLFQVILDYTSEIFDSLRESSERNIEFYIEGQPRRRPSRTFNPVVEAMEESKGEGNKTKLSISKHRSFSESLECDKSSNAFKYDQDTSSEHNLYIQGSPNLDSPKKKLSVDNTEYKSTSGRFPLIKEDFTDDQVVGQEPIDDIIPMPSGTPPPIPKKKDTETEIFDKEQKKQKSSKSLKKSKHKSNNSSDGKKKSKKRGSKNEGDKKVDDLVLSTSDWKLKRRKSGKDRNYHLDFPGEATHNIVKRASSDKKKNRKS